MAEETIQQPFLDTYSALTAESVFSYANVHFSRDDLVMQLAARDSFYTSLIQVPVHVVLNSLLNTQCRDLQTYSQERLIEYILSGAENKMVSEADIELKNKIEAERLRLIQLGSDLTALETAHYQFMLAVYVLQEKQASQWSEEAIKQMEILWDEIEQCKPDISAESKGRLLHFLKTQAATIVLSDKELKSLKIKETPSSVEKAAIKLFSDISAQVCPNVLETAKEVEADMRQFQQQLAQQRELLVTTVGQVKDAYLEKIGEFADIRERVNALLLEVDENVDAFKPSEDTLNNNLNMNNLVELGLE
jgi:hypothetical protein